MAHINSPAGLVRRDFSKLQSTFHQIITELEIEFGNYKNGLPQMELVDATKALVVMFSFIHHQKCENTLIFIE